MYKYVSGHGKLLLGDGGYYEGTFAYGEIEGHGYRVFGLSGATYSGQFHRGEMHGQGVLCYPNGEQYEGSWAKGRKEGNDASIMLYVVFITGLQFTSFLSMSWKPMHNQ